MKKFTSHLIALLLTGGMLLTFAGCNEEAKQSATGGSSPLAPQTQTTSPTTSTAPNNANPITDESTMDAKDRFLEKFPENLNFASLGFSDDDLIVRVAYVEGIQGDNVRRSLKADSEACGEVNAATQKRNARLKEQLGLKLEPISVGSISDMEFAIGTGLAAGISEYDILAGYQYFGMRMASKGYLLNLNGLAEDANYIDLNADYWAREYNKKISYKGAYFWITGDLALNYIGGAYCTYVNTEIYDRVLKDNYGSIYTIVKEGKWTLDLLHEMAAQCEGDIYGFGYEPNDMIDGLVIGSGVPFTEVNSDTGEVSLVFGNQDTNCFGFAEKLSALAQDPSSHEYPYTQSASVMRAFASGTLAFTVNQLYQSQYYLPSSMDHFTVIPVPKYDEAQANYITGQHDGCTVFGITYCTNKVAQAAATLEFLCAYSAKEVKPIYYDVLFDGRYSNSSELAEMINLIQDNISTDFAVAWSEVLDDQIYLFRACHKLSESNIIRSRYDWMEHLSDLTTDLDHYVV